MIYYLDEFIEKLQNMRYSNTNKITINGSEIDKIVIGDYNNIDVWCRDAKTIDNYEKLLEEKEDEIKSLRVDLDLLKDTVEDTIESLESTIRTLRDQLYSTR